MDAETRRAVRAAAAQVGKRLAQAGPDPSLRPCVSLMEIAQMFGWVWSTAYSLSSKGILPDPDLYLGKHPCWLLPTIYRWADGENMSGRVREIVWDPWGVRAPATPVPPMPERPARERRAR